jgi:hypothetical protein
MRVNEHFLVMTMMTIVETAEHLMEGVIYFEV